MAILQELMGFNVQFRVKCVQSSASSVRWEWMDIDVGDSTEAVMKAFSTKSIPFYLNGSIIRIQGYTRPEQLPI